MCQFQFIATRAHYMGRRNGLSRNSYIYVVFHELRGNGPRTMSVEPWQTQVLYVYRYCRSNLRITLYLSWIKHKKSQHHIAQCIENRVSVLTVVYDR